MDIYRDEGHVETAEISALEKSIGCHFPPSYKDLICKHNALRGKKNNFRFSNQHWNSGWSYALNNGFDSRDISFLGFGNSLDSWNLLENTQDFDGRAPDSIVAFGVSANGDYICFDYRSDTVTDNPKIVVMFHDAFDERGQMLICDVANTFDEFIDALY